MSNKITGQVLGGAVKVMDSVDTVQDVFNELGLTGNYAATINGEPAEMDSELNDYELVHFAPSVKGGQI